MEKVEDRFIRYAKIDTQSDEKNSNCPSTDKQFNLAKLLEKELAILGLSNVKLDENCYITATLPSNTTKKLPVIGFISHIDTSPDMSGKNVSPKITSSYSGEDIILNKKHNIVLSPDDFPQLLSYVGHNLITTDGTTLLGADNKAGIAEILTAMEFFVSNPEIEHGTIKIGFTPDEEIGRGADKFDVEGFGADFAYTIDGGQLGELEYENFNAALATIKFFGRNVHPGTAKNQMINSIFLAKEFIDLLPLSQRPEHTEAYEGFYHLIDFTGSVEESIIRYLVRDHDKDLFKLKKQQIQEASNSINQRFKDKRVEIEIKDQYFNMREKIEPLMHIVKLAEDAIVKAGVKPIIKPIRGGTDGARLSFIGLPCPNIFTGGHNFHGKYEYISIQAMEKAVETIKNIATLAVQAY